jgi:predicted GH43/DUF377 family glycosyl hydrolase
MNLPFLNDLRTPFKANRFVLAPSYRQGDFDSHAVDCPFPFSHDGHFFMTYVGWDGIGYRTGLASSTDLEQWQKEGIILDRGPEGSITQYNAALTSIFRDNTLFGPATLKKIGGRYVGAYHAYPNPGYEEGPAVIGLCFSDDLRNWELGQPILEPNPGCPWESGGLYKAWLTEHEGLYYLFYNAKNTPAWPWVEQTGVATSRDLVHWERSPLNPLLPIGKPGQFDDVFASDPVVLQHGQQWLMFYFGNCSDGHARDGIAFSNDLLHWDKSGEILIDVGSAGSIDSLHAHKPGIITKDRRLFHYYCAVCSTPQKKMGNVTVDEIRGITFAVNRQA